MTNMNDWATRQKTIQRYLDAETSSGEEKALLDFYMHTKETLSAEEEQMRKLVLSTVHLADDFDLSDEKAKEFDLIMAERELSSRKVVWPWIAAACVAAFMAVLMAPPKDDGSSRKDDRGTVLSMEAKKTKEDVHHTSKPENHEKRTPNTPNHPSSTIQKVKTTEEYDQSDLVSVEKVFGIESRPDPMEEYTALEEKLQKECDEVFLKLMREN